MGDQSNETSKYEVCFVQTDDSLDNISEALRLAFEALDQNQLDPIWIKVTDCLKVTKKETKLFVIDPFEGVAFEHLKAYNCRIMGPLCILYCLQYNDTLPKRLYPVYSVTMRKITVSCSNIPSKMREDICSKVELMGGFFSKDFTKSVTHLVVGEVGSQKYQVAASLGLPVMVPEWITDVWENGQFKQLHATDSCYNKYKCPVFKGLVICVSQVTLEERQAIRVIVEENGGSYSGALKVHETTHLVLNEPSGDKYRFAKSWKVICVQVSWIHDSVEAGYCRDEKLYPIDESAQTGPKRSTPKKNLTSIGLPLVDCSAIAGHPTVSHLDETVKSNASFLDVCKRDSYAAIDDFILSNLPKSGQFLDGCKIYLTGFSPVHMDKLRKIVNAGGGIRFSKFSDSISHVVCEEPSEEFLKLLKSSSVKPFVVNFKWLLECCKNEKLVDEKQFLIMDVNALSPEKVEIQKPQKDNSIHASQNNSQVNKKENSVCGSQTNSQASKKDEFSTDNITDILKQYINKEDIDLSKENDKNKNPQSLSDNAKSNTISSEMQLVQGDDVNKCEESNFKAEPDVKFDSNKQNAVENNAESIDEEEDVINLFEGLTFVVVGFEEKDTEILSSMITSHSGSLVKKANSSAIAVVPLVWNVLKLAVSNFVTNCWVQKCIEEARMFDFDENELFRPFDLDVNNKPFKGFVISFSQYVGIERDCLIHLSEYLGAVCQEYFVRKSNASKGVLSNTHLVVSTPEGSKYEASKKWKIPAVTKQWVIDTAKSGIAPPMEDYFVEKHSKLPERKEENHSSVVSEKKLNSLTDKNKKGDNVSNHSRTSELSSDYQITDHKLSPPTSIEKKSFKTDSPRGDQQLPGASNNSPKLKHNRVAELCNQSRSESMNQSPHHKTELSLDSCLGLDKTANLKFQISGILNDLDASVSRCSFDGNKSIPVEEMFGKHLTCALQRLDEKSLAELTGGSSFSLKEIKEHKDSCVLEGVVVCVSKKLTNIQTELNEIVLSLGGDYILNYDDSCTHYVYVGKANDLTKEFREARSHGKKIVSPEWIYACKESNKCVGEELYPHTYKANMSLSQQISIIKVASDCKTPKHENTKAQSETVPDKAKNGYQTPSRVRTRSDNSNEVDFNKQLNELLVRAKSAKKRYSKRLANSASSSPVSNVSPIQKTQRHLSDIYVKPTKTEDAAAEEMPDTCSQLSQTYPIQWDDPTGRMEREKIAARAAKNAEKMNTLATEEETADASIMSVDLCLLKHTEVAPVKKFMFTNISEHLKMEYIKTVKKLGGEVSDEKSFDITATHLVSSNPIKNEKFLSSVASGKWILHSNYLSASLEQNNFVSEVEFEWGGPQTNKFIQNLPASSVQLSKCPCRWRSEIQQGKTSGAFDTWKVVIHADDQAKLANYSKILESGGAEVIPTIDAKHNLDRITHVFVDARKRGASKVDLSSYIAHSIKCLRPEYLAFYLIEDPSPDAENFLFSGSKECQSNSYAVKKRSISTASSRLSKRTKLK